MSIAMYNSSHTPAMPLPFTQICGDAHFGGAFVLQESTVIRKFRTTAAVGKNFNIQFYNLDALIAVGFRVNSTRASERKFYQKITDIYATAMDYSAESETTQTFFATVQNKLPFAIHGRHLSSFPRMRESRIEHWI